MFMLKYSKSLLLFTLVILLAGCSSPAAKLLSSDNVYYYYLDEYNDLQCTKVYNESCEAKANALSVMWVKLDRAKLALKRGGSLPLQLKDVKNAEKVLKGVNKK